MKIPLSTYLIWANLPMPSYCSWENPLYSLLDIMTVPTKEDSFARFKSLSKKWIIGNEAERIELERLLFNIGWIRQGTMWLHKEDLDKIIY